MQYKSGFSNGMLSGKARQNWDASGPRPVSWAAWYPVSQEAEVAEKFVGDDCANPLFSMGSVWQKGAISDAKSKWPLVLLSHGTGGSAEGMGWLGKRLACHGYVCIGVSHHGNTANEPYRAEGFLCWWERALDISCILDHLDKITPVKDRIDETQIAVAGFSLGGYTALALAGAITSMDQFQTWHAANSNGMDGPREFPELGSRIPHLMSESVVFRDSWEKHAQPFADNRIRRCIAMAPAPPVRAFLVDSLAAITCSTILIAGEADREAPFDQCAAWLKEKNQAFHLHSLGSNVGHYEFICECTHQGMQTEPEICTDYPHVNRRELHDEVANGIIRQFLEPA